jgi:hypothetical protein
VTAEALKEDAPGTDTDVLEGWNPTALRQFRAGVMQVEAEGKRLTPLPDKGVLFLETSEADGLMVRTLACQEHLSCGVALSLRVCMVSILLTVALCLHFLSPLISLLVACLLSPPCASLSLARALARSGSISCGTRETAHPRPPRTQPLRPPRRNSISCCCQETQRLSV